MDAPTAIHQRDVPRRHQKKDIKFLELLAVLESLRAFAPQLANAKAGRFVIHTDNENARFSLTSGSIKDPLCQSLVREIFAFGLGKKLDLSLVRVSAEANILADLLSRRPITSKYSVTLPSHLLAVLFQKRTRSNESRPTHGAGAHTVFAQDPGLSHTAANLVWHTISSRSKRSALSTVHSCHPPCKPLSMALVASHNVRCTVVASLQAKRSCQSRCFWGRASCKCCQRSVLLPGELSSRRRSASPSLAFPIVAKSAGTLSTRRALPPSTQSPLAAHSDVHSHQ